MARKARIAYFRAQVKFSWEQAGAAMLRGDGEACQLHADAAVYAEQALMHLGAAPIVL